MVSYTLSKRSTQDIQTITRHSVEDFGKQQTLKYMGGMKKTLQRLADSPDLGRLFTHDRTQREYHFYRYQSHVIYYRKRKIDIFVVRILHGRMLPERHL